MYFQTSIYIILKNILESPNTVAFSGQLTTTESVTIQKMKKLNLRKHFNTPFYRRLVPVIVAAMMWLGTGDRCFGQYLHTQGKQIVDGQGREVILRGMGLGGWMLQ